MSYTPDRLWCWRDPIAGYVGQTSHARNGASEYIRADLYEALKAENERLREALEQLSTSKCFGSGEIVGLYLPKYPLGREIIARMDYARAALSATKPAAEPLDMTRPGDRRTRTPAGRERADQGGTG